MQEGYKQGFTSDLATQTRPRHRFLPLAALPADLPRGRVPIADMANAFGVTHRTLHFYEEKGLISASRIGLMRVYEPGDVMRMAVINACREAGMAVAVIQDLMNDLVEAGSQEAAETLFRDALVTRKRELSAEMSTLHRQMQQVNELLDHEATDDQTLNDNQGGSPLTDQELRCLALMAAGLSTQRIARTLDLPNDDAQNLESGIIVKFRANNRFQAIAQAVMLGVVQV
ncbi:MULTISPECIES: MerR family transcriptional regulator [Rhizobium]|uniref:HTH-type transcriptional regulator cueR Copper efflux regulator n=1 Tax=Rhizobium favelukesii TaxID=348824 RepID=W6RHR0_9HYPH|nr:MULTISPECIES: MerR family transcriptional regulator [Rhizobium]MCS0457638.1 MerR family transcriptional regulator [Rhizobium favelukesii]UFS84040.1 MerR family transcriptional regulator [Rhizobium sp. T136]CDM58313.1 HTH-type transcriptional regulator cueR Copper efflux regulator [Rhizobium favelukesii]